jgi:SAM-dependent methyltransferase
MPTLVPDPAKDQPHRARRIAESFGADVERYDRTRPRYPQALVDKIMADIPGRDLLDVGIGTGVSARPFRAAEFRVLGVEVDARMAAFARQDGFDVEVAKFEDWDAAGRTFDLVIAGMTWHWVDPTAGAAKAAALLRPGGRLAAFWNVGQPPRELAQAFSVVYKRVLPNTPFADMPRDPLAAYERFFASTADEFRLVGAFGDLQRWQVDWEQPYTTAQWLDQVPTFGGHSQFSPSTLEELLDGIGTTIDRFGGTFTMRYAAVAVATTRQQNPRSRPSGDSC